MRDYAAFLFFFALFHAFIEWAPQIYIHQYYLKIPLLKTDLVLTYNTQKSSLLYKNILKWSRLNYVERKPRTNDFVSNKHVVLELS